ncbi:MAG: 16S rRNA (cytidine(1402)-2'-O)-methyltransferase, partial [Parachlamydiaceae bacterium]|nr:16S rRNA (cytidine(1402)-2'-O)-methyltransferase [Parachlamydiaceae bacterium]
MLSLVATPIGNLSDITFRAIETLKESDYILCEDTRYSARLLSHYNIQKPCRSLHKFNETSQVDKIIADLREGKKIALITDAGTPGISDPGELLVHSVIQAGMPVRSIPGACAAIVALTSSGLPTSRFQFYGFLPRKENELKQTFLHILNYEGTTICYESPKRLCKTLEQLAALDNTRTVAIARELTKIHEEILHGNAMEVLAMLNEDRCRGEIILLIKGLSEPTKTDWSDLSPVEHVKMIEKTYHISHLEAIKMAAKLRGVPKREIYQL